MLSLLAHALDIIVIFFFALILVLWRAEMMHAVGKLSKCLPMCVWLCLLKVTTGDCKLVRRPSLSLSCFVGQRPSKVDKVASQQQLHTTHEQHEYVVGSSCVLMCTDETSTDNADANATMIHGAKVQILVQNKNIAIDMYMCLEIQSSSIRRAQINK